MNRLSHEANKRFEEVLRGSALMRFVPEAHQARLRERFTAEHFEFGEVIVRQGDPADAFFILVSGRARVIKTSATGEELPLNRLTPGDEFGEGALLDGGVRAASIRASTTVEALRLDRAHFLALAKEVPALRESPLATTRSATADSASGRTAAVVESLCSVGIGFELLMGCLLRSDARCAMMGSTPMS